MKKIFALIVALLTVGVSAHAVTISQHWEKVYKMGWIDVPLSIQQTMDGGYIVAGISSFSSQGAGVLKLDSNGNISWLKTFDIGSWASSIQQTLDGGYIVVTPGIGLFKLDSNGNISWQKYYMEDECEWSDCRVGSHPYVQQTTDGGYVVAGNFGPRQWWQGDQDFWIITLDSVGNIIWQNTYGGSGTEAPSIAEETLFVQQTTDGGYIVTGLTESFGDGSPDFWVLKLDSNGNVSWQKTYGGSYADQPYSIQQTVDGGYIVAGAFLVIKLDPDGNMTWHKKYTTNGGSVSLRVTSIQQISDGGYIMTGGAVGADLQLFVMRIDSNGNPSWLNNFQETLSGYVPRIRQTQDGGYIVSASSKNDDGWDFWVLKLNSEGTIPGCDAIVNAEVIITDYSISTQDTEAIIQSPVIILVDTSWEAVDRTTTISTICYYEDPDDIDGDGISNNPGGGMASSIYRGDFLADEDNCPDMPNGPYLGTCIAGDTFKIGRPCISDVECGTDGFCSMNQEDSTGTGMGDACYLCECDFDCNGNVDATDAINFLTDFGRGGYNDACTNEEPCNGDFNCDANVDAADVTKLLEDFGRNQYNNPCPDCEVGNWCVYP